MRPRTPTMSIHDWKQNRSSPSSVSTLLANEYREEKKRSPVSEGEMNFFSTRLVAGYSDSGHFPDADDGPLEPEAPKSQRAAILSSRLKSGFELKIAENPSDGDNRSSNERN